MERRLFDDLVVSRRGAKAARAGGMPASFAIHAAGLAALLAAAAIAPIDLPAPRLPPDGPIVDLAPRPPAGGGAPPRVRPRNVDRRPEPSQDAPVVDPAPLPEADPFAEVDAPPCPECLPDDGSPGPGGEGPGPPGLPGGSGDGPATAVPERVRVGGHIEAPRKIRHVDPLYPELARRAGVTGMVILECVIDRDGKVDRVVVLRGHPLLDAAAVDAVRQWTYRPTLLNGVPVEVVMTVTVRFAAAR